MAIVAAIAGVSACAGNDTPVVNPPPPVPSSIGPMQRVIPAPVSTEPASGNGFAFTADTVILAEPGDGVMRVARYLADVIGAATGPKPPRVEAASGTPRAGSVRLVLTPSGPAAAGTLDESYELTIAPDRVTIAAPNAAGLFYGVQTLRQLLPPCGRISASAAADKARVLVAPAGRIVDRPRFAWRGAMLDVARHFFTVEDVKRYIDLHRAVQGQQAPPSPVRRSGLADRDQVVAEAHDARWKHGKSAAAPAASTRRSSMRISSRTRHDRFITIVPEIDMPGHTNAASVVVSAS